MFRKPLFALAVISMVACTPLVLLAQEPPPAVEVPIDFPVWGGISLSVGLNFLVFGLRAIGVIKDGTPIKKSIGFWLALVGAFAGGSYGYANGATADPMLFFQMIAGGAFAGLTAVGMHSTVKNFKERK